jgi:hypothetical protein
MFQIFYIYHKIINDITSVNKVYFIEREKWTLI